MNARDNLLYFSIVCNGEWDSIFSKIKSREEVDEDKVQELVDNYERMGVHYITILDKEYPSYLKQQYKPPLVLFYVGNINLLDSNKTRLTIANSRSNPLPNEVAQDILGNNDYVYVLGNANEFECSNQVIYVLPSGIDQCEKSVLTNVLDKGGLIVSEYPNGVAKSQLSCLNRNRLLSHFANKLLVLSCPSKSGIVAIITFALSSGKDILVVPTSPSLSEGMSNNMFISQGAIPVWDNGSFLNAMS